MRSTWIAALLVCCGGPRAPEPIARATSAVSIGVERAVDLPVPAGPTPHVQTQAAVASDGADYLVAWTHQRPELGRSDLHGSLVDGATGEVLHPGGIQIGKNIRPLSGP